MVEQQGDEQAADRHSAPGRVPARSAVEGSCRATRHCTTNIRTLRPGRAGQLRGDMQIRCADCVASMSVPEPGRVSRNPPYPVRRVVGEMSRCCDKTRCAVRRRVTRRPGARLEFPAGGGALGERAAPQQHATTSGAAVGWQWRCRGSGGGQQQAECAERQISVAPPSMSH
jgi:hypothetical protein